MGNIKLSHMSHWKTVPYKKIPNFREFYYEDKRNEPYFLDYDKILKYHKANNYQGIEIAPWDVAEIMSLFGTPEEFRAFVNSYGLEISGMFHGMRGGKSLNNLESNLKSTEFAASLIERFGGTEMGCCPGGSYFSEGPLNDGDIKNVIHTLNEMGKISEDHGVHMGIHNEFFCSVNKENHIRVIEGTDPKYVHYYLDTAQVSIIGVDLCEFYDTYYDRVTSFHLKDTADPGLADEVRYSRDVEIQDDGHRWFWEVGYGVLDFPGLWKLLKKHGFKGWISVETDGTPDLLASMALASYEVHEVLGKIYE